MAVKITSGAASEGLISPSNLPKAAEPKKSHNDFFGRDVYMASPRTKNELIGPIQPTTIDWNKEVGMELVKKYAENRRPVSADSKTLINLAAIGKEC